MNTTIIFSVFDWVILLVYLGFVIWIGYYLKPFIKNDEDYFLVGARPRGFPTARFWAICWAYSSGAAIAPKISPSTFAARYKIVYEKVIQVEAKSDIKKRLGRSPDKGDAVVYANAMRSEITGKKRAPIQTAMI